MSEPVHERVGAATSPMEGAVYELLDRLDEYRKTMVQIISEQEASGDPNRALVRRLRQFEVRAEKMISIVEDDVITELLFCIDRLFSVKDAEDGKFI